RRGGGSDRARRVLRALRGLAGGGRRGGRTAALPPHRRGVRRRPRLRRPRPAGAGVPHLRLRRRHPGRGRAADRGGRRRRAGRALHAARERGYDEGHVNRVLLVGGSSLIPCVRRTVQRIFGRERVLLDRPLDAVARGAAAFVAGVDFYDHIQHDYAIRFVDPQKGDYDYRPLVKRGTPYPTGEPVARLTVKATYDGQPQLGIAIYELGERRAREASGPVELVFDPTGAARVVSVTPDEEE